MSMAADSVDSLTRAATEPGAAPHRSAAGRRRDPTIDERLMRAARALYAREGWAGFHFEGVARTAGVSKDAVYRRYPDAQALLLEALSAQSVARLADDLPIEDALLAFACDAFAYFAGGDGYANLRVHLDARQYPEILEQYRVRVLEPQMRHAVGVLERARDNGELHPDTSCTAVFEALAGAVMFHALSSPPRLSSAGDEDSVDPATMRRLTECVRQILHGRLR
jgi:AcrR family transcriptional regulator